MTRFYLEGDAPLASYATLFSALDRLHRSVGILDQIGAIDAAAIDEETWSEVTSRRLLGKKKTGQDDGPFRVELSTQSLLKSGLISTPPQLELWAMNVASPGSIDLLGLGAVLEQIRLWAADRAERRKDKAYRSEAERTRGRLENTVLFIDGAQRTTDLLLSLGMSQDDVRGYIAELLSDAPAVIERQQLQNGFGKELPDQTD